MSVTASLLARAGWACGTVPCGMSVMALQRGWSAFAACRALRAAGRAQRVLPAAGLHAPPRASLERRPQRSWLWAAVAPAPLAASPAARAFALRPLHVTTCCEGGNLPATFVAPTKVNMDDYPPPKRRLSKDDVVVQFVRSGGAGGQNVNKVNTKADIRFDVLGADWLPDWVKENLLEQEKNRMNSDGELVVNSSRHRTQKQNYEDAVEKLQAMIDAAAKPPTGPSDETIKKVKTLAKKANQKRLDSKKKDSQRKAERRSRDYD